MDFAIAIRERKAARRAIGYELSILRIVSETPARFRGYVDREVVAERVNVSA